MLKNDSTYFKLYSTEPDTALVEADHVGSFNCKRLFIRRLPYVYGKDYVRMELLERLRRAGFEVGLRNEDCERFVVIDNQVVWYGSINLLSKEDAEIAAEVLELM